MSTSKECECPNIVQYHGSFLHEEQLWILMEFCEGSLPRHHGRDRQCLTQQQVAAALSGCVEALLYLHRRHKVHRDVKAGNLLLSSDGIVKLADLASPPLLITRRAGGPSSARPSGWRRR